MTTSSFAATILESARLLLEDRRSALADRALEARAELRPWLDGEDCEIRVTFWHGTSLVDFFEGFVVQGGEPTASMDEIRSWLATSIDDAVSEAGSP